MRWGEGKFSCRKSTAIPEAVGLVEEGRRGDCSRLMSSEDSTPESVKVKAGDTVMSGDQPSRRFSTGGLAWLGLLVLQLAMFAACTRGAWMRPDLEWVAWVSAGGALPMLMMRRIVPPSLLAAEPRWLFAVSLALLLVGGVIFTGLRGVLGETLFVTLGAFSLGMGLWLSALGVQGRPGRRERTAVLSPALEGPYIEALVRRPSVWLAMLMVFCVAAGVWFSASMWPRITVSAPGVDRTGGEAIAALLAFWVGILVGAAPIAFGLGGEERLHRAKDAGNRSAGCRSRGWCGSLVAGGVRFRAASGHRLWLVKDPAACGGSAEERKFLRAWKFGWPRGS